MEKERDLQFEVIDPPEHFKEINLLGLPQMYTNRLARAGVTTIDQLLQYTTQELRRKGTLGEKTIQIAIEKAEAFREWIEMLRTHGIDPIQLRAEDYVYKSNNPPIDYDELINKVRPVGNSLDNKLSIMSLGKYLPYQQRPEEIKTPEKWVELITSLPRRERAVLTRTIVKSGKIVPTLYELRLFKEAGRDVRGIGKLQQRIMYGGFCN